MAKVKIGTLSNPDTRLDKNSGNAIANNAVALALEALIPNYLEGKSAEAFKRTTDKLIVKDSTFTDFPASVHVFSNGIFSGPDGLMMPTDRTATGGENFHGIFFRQQNEEGEFVYSNKLMMAGSINLPVYDRINDRYIISAEYGVFYGVPSGTIPNRTISWTRYNNGIFNSGDNCAPSAFIVERFDISTKTSTEKCISLIGRACSNNGGAGWYGITSDGTSSSRAPSAIINEVVVACKPSGGLEYSTTLVPEMFKSSPTGSAITWTDVPEFSNVKFTGLTMSTLPNGVKVIYAKSNGMVVLSYDGITWDEVFSYTPDVVNTGRKCVFITDSGGIVVATEDDLWFSDMLPAATIEMTKCSISGSDWRTPTVVRLDDTTFYVTTRVSSYGLAVSTDGKNWTDLSAINFSDTTTKGIIDNPVVFDGNIYFPTYDGINYIRMMPVTEFFEMIALDRIVSEHIDLLPEGSTALFDNEDLRDKINELISVVNAIRKIVKA